MINNFTKTNEYLVRLSTQQESTNIVVEKQFKESILTSCIINNSDQSVAIKEVVLSYGKMPFSKDTKIYGEAYNMLSQNGGTIGKIEDIGAYNEKKHYNFPQKTGFTKIYNMLMFMLGNDDVLLLGFTSCNRFSGEFRINKDEYEIVMDFAGISIRPNEKIDMEDLFIAKGNRLIILDVFAQHISTNHTMKNACGIPIGWCSWLVYGPKITQQNIYDNIAAIKNKVPELKYIQIDDGYQAYMGDWLTEGKSFKSGIQKLCLDIKETGHEPAIWVAPFIAEADSEIFKNNPEWFVSDDDGQPLASDKVSFGGWRHGPWYMLDGTHPEARKHLEHIFSVMRNEWQVKYYKLDANMWGAMPFGNRYMKDKTYVEAYRMGMEAIIKGAGGDSFILGCNAPMWPSLGLVDGMRITCDNSRSWNVFLSLARECFPRNWQNNKLWINDPDTILQENKDIEVMGPDGKKIINSTSLSYDEFLFNATYTLASGGMVLSSDDITNLSDYSIKILQKLIPSTGVAAQFDDTSYQIGRMHMNDKTIVCVFNYDDIASKIVVPIIKKCQVKDFWTDEDMGEYTDAITIEKLNPHSARALVLKYN